MAFLFRWLSRLILVTILGGVAGIALLYYFASASLPDYDRPYTVSGLSAPVEIVRDNHAIPHIFGASDNDVFFGLGFVHAQDRLWQMMLNRRIVQGRLAEIFGRDALEIDKFMRSLDIYTISQRSVRLQSAETLDTLKAYSAGINAWLETVRDEALGRGAPEFFLFSREISPWTPADSIAIGKLMALQASDKAQLEVLRARLSLVLSPERLADILPDAPGAPVISLPEFAAADRLDGSFAEYVRPPALPYDPLPQVGRAGASNAWAATGKRSATGSALLAVDPHLGLTAPSAWMLARLELQSGGVIGATIPGLPWFPAGRNQRLGWGATASYLDDQDLYYERLNPDNPDMYLTAEGFVPFTFRDVLIKIKDEPPLKYRLRWAGDRPVLPPSRYGLETITPAGHEITLAWTGLDPEDRTIEGFLGLMRAGSIIEARDAVASVLTPSQNLVLAEKNSIAIQVIGRVPKRDPDHSSQGRLPAPAWLPENLWQGYFPYASNLFTKDPPGGIVVNTNNKITDSAFPRHFSFDWGDALRIRRATRLLNAREFHTLDSFIEIQTDTVSPAARILLPLIARDLWYVGEPAVADSVPRMRQVALEMLAKWNGDMSEHDPEPLIYAAWVRALQRRLTLDDLGTLIESLPKIDPIFIERVFRDVDGAGIWCDIKQTSVRETCQDMARIALDEALIYLSEKYGPRLESWRWGEAHQALHENSVLGRVPGVSWFANIWQDTPGGDTTLMRGQTKGFGPLPFTNVHGSVFRAVYDFADPDSSVFILSTGQSGHLLSRHYDDLSVLWRRGEYIPMSLDPVLARGNAVGITQLIPAQ